MDFPCLGLTIMKIDLKLNARSLNSLQTQREARKDAKDNGLYCKIKKTLRLSSKLCAFA